MTEPAILLRDVALHHGAAGILRGIDLRIMPGEAVALLGRNGAGKTTLVHALFNLGARRSGTLRVLGQEVAGWATHRIARAGLALVPQGRGTFPNLTVTESLRLATVAGRRGAWTLERVFAAFPRLAERRAFLCSALSGGERQLLAMGRALLTQPRVLVLDEPSEGLAPLVAEEIIAGTVRQLVADGMTVLLAEQNIPLALRLCPRAAVLDGGTIVFDGPSSGLMADRGLMTRSLGV